MITAAIRDILINNAAVTAIVGLKVYPIVLPQNAALPSLVYQEIFNAPSDDISGSAGLFNATIQVDCWTKTYSEVIALDDAVRLALQTYKGENLGVNIRGIYLNQSFEDFEPEIKNYRRGSRFSVWYWRDAPL